MFTTTLWPLLLFSSRVFASILVSDVYWGQGECDTAVDPFKNKQGETPCTIALALLVPCNVNVSESSTAQINGSACACNLEFYNLLSACAWFCIRQTVDPFYTWSQNCGQGVPLTQDYPYPTSISTVIPGWASKKLSSSGNFDPSVVTREGWTTVQKVTPVIVGLGVLLLVGLFWCLFRVYKRRKYSRRAQGSFRHQRNQSTLSYSSTSHLNPNRLSLPVHRIRFFFRGMFPVRERHKNPDWNIEGDSGLSRRSSAVYDPPARPESGSSFASTPSIHFQNDTPPIHSRESWLPLQSISRWWTSISPSKSKDYQSVHLLSTRKNSKFGADDDDHPEPAFTSPPLQNQALTPRNDRTSEDGLEVVVISDGERESVSRPQTPQPETEPPTPKRSRPQSLRPNRPGHIVAVDNPPPTQPLPSADAPTTSTATPDLSAFLPPPGIRGQPSSDTFYTSHTTLSTDRESEQTVKPKKLGPELLFPASVRAAGYSIPQRSEDPVVKAWISRPNGTSNRPADKPTAEPPSYDQANSPAPPLPRPISPTSLHPYPYTNHLRSTSDLTALADSRSPRLHLQDLDAIDTQSETLLRRLSLAVNEPTSAPTSEGGSADGETDLFPASIVHGSEVSKNLEYTPYPSSTLLPLSSAGIPRVGQRSPPER